ncbi:sigma-70 family RNA polymerase sigma factor [Luteolibacter sp. LG18]|uniref:RNA polymerase sigma factor n=1 Tax=Luteolibacter sp. LG18 TaxID=2819286 RepID=UPI002B295874|nr:RNA polymerase subunit sigma-24 [Luteolibacter sp. LG18]
MSTEIPRLTDHLFRHEAGKLVSALTGIFGIHRLQLAEDVVQEAMVRALQTWPYHGIPDNPAAWLMQTAKRRALDLIRREKVFHDKLPEITASLEQWPESDEHAPRFEDEIKDGRLRLMFACCHPDIPQDAQTALALKTLCAFSPAEIASAFLTTEAAIAKRLTRARQRIAEAGIPFEIPAGEELAPRLDGVLRILYLLFNEGYSASSGDSVIRAELCHEAIRLADALVQHPAANHPRMHALLALMLLNASRLPAREDLQGNILLLKDQDRGLWDHAMIGRGLRHLALSARGDDLTEYHLQAGIAAHHSTAPDAVSTHWPGILAHYDRWLTISDSPVVALNRAVACAEVHGPEAGITALEPIWKSGQLERYYLLHAVLGDLQERLGDSEAAAASFTRALQLTAVKAEQLFLTDRLRACLVK